MMLAIVKVLPEPVTPKSVCSCAPARIPRVNASIASGWSPVGLNAVSYTHLVKLATELSKRPTGRTVYILDEPTTGLHTADVHKLIDVLQAFVDAGNTVITIEHNLEVIKTEMGIRDRPVNRADFLIERSHARLILVRLVQLRV